MPGTPDLTRPRTILAFDFGLRRIGVAVGQTTTQTATALRTVSNGPEPDWAAVDRLVAEWRPQLLVVGLPLVLALAWGRLLAPDVALAEAAIGAGLSGALLLAAVRGQQRERSGSSRDAGYADVPPALRWAVTLLCAGLAGILGWALLEAFDSSARDTLAQAVAANLATSGVSNPVTAVLLNFRAYDTLLELAVLRAFILVLFADLAFAAGRLDPAVWQVRRLSEPMPDVVVLVSRRLAQGVRLDLQEALSVLGRRREEGGQLAQSALSDEVVDVLVRGQLGAQARAGIRLARHHRRPGSRELTGTGREPGALVCKSARSPSTVHIASTPSVR